MKSFCSFLGGNIYVDNRSLLIQQVQIKFPISNFPNDTPFLLKYMLYYHNFIKQNAF